MPSARIFAVNGEAYFSEDARSVNDDVLLYLENPYFNTLSISEYTDNPFLTMVERLASAELYRKAVHAARVIDYRGILYALSGLSAGIYTELRAIGSGTALADLAKFGHGGLILSVERSLADAFAATIEEVGLTATRVARAIPGNRVTVRVEGGAPYSCLTALIRGVGELSPQLVVTMPKEPTAPHEEIGLFSEAPCGDLLPRIPEIYPSPLSDGFSYTAFSLDSPDFFSVIRQALSAVYRSVVGGVKPMAAYTVCTYPTEVNSTSIGKVLSTMLGLYRVFAELSVPMQSAFIRNDREGCSVFLRGKTDGDNKPTTCFTGAEHPVYLLYPRSDECGFPNFSDIRAILSQLQKNSPIAASVHCGESVASAVVSMCASHGIRYSAQLSGDLLGETIDLPYLIVECAEEIPSLPLLGNVSVSSVPAKDTVEDSDTVPHIEPLRALSAVSSPEALLVVPIASASPYPLKTRLEKDGFFVTVATIREMLEKPKILSYCHLLVFAETRESYRDAILASQRVRHEMLNLLQREGVFLMHSSLAEDLHSLELKNFSTEGFGGSGIYCYDRLKDGDFVTIRDFYR